MKILSPTAIRQLEQETKIRQNLTAHCLMERAARAVFQALQQIAGENPRRFVVLCGFGNNGGDGLALSNLLYQAGHQVQVYLFEHHRYSTENLFQQEQVRNAGISIAPLHPDSSLIIPEPAFIIDALFGHGLSRPLAQEWIALTRQLQASNNPVFAIDVPSGLLADQPLPVDAPIVEATITYTFACPKLCLLLPDYAAYTGNFCVLDIGLDPEIHARSETDCYYTDKQAVTKLVRPLQKFAHKGTFGHALIAGGQHGSIGAVVLASKGALKTGCGLVTAYIPTCGYEIVQSSFPEALTRIGGTSAHLESFPPDILNYTALGIGMGMGTHPQSQKALQQLLVTIAQATKRPALLLDADAINILAMHEEWHELLPAETILTPHPKELQRLIGTWENDFIKLKKAKAWSKRFQQILIIKGANTAVVFPEGEIHFNATGNPGMATGGAGDVLSGVITSLLAQGYPSRSAALIGVYLHGLAADCATSSIHEKSLIATDIVQHLSDAWQRILPRNGIS